MHNLPPVRRGLGVLQGGRGAIRLEARRQALSVRLGRQRESLQFLCELRMRVSHSPRAN